MPLSRRHFVSGLAATTAGTSLSLLAEAKNIGRYFPHPQDLLDGPAFRHGVASGDPKARRVILWTRVTPKRFAWSIPVEWKIATDPLMKNPVASGYTVAKPQRDYTIKLDPKGLSPDTTYYYQFYALGESSPIGRTRTLPVGYVEKVRLGVTSCSNYAFGFFSAYGHLANRADLNAVLHLGDYIYEYANAEFGDGEAIGRQPFPNKEIVSLSDYRQRHAQYKSDMHLQECHRQHPFICVWDDHETTNDAFKDGAENHQPELEGSWELRKAVALQAYFEWMPIRETGRIMRRSANIFRRFRFGELADLMMLETRLVARSQQLPNIIDPFSGQLLLDDPANELPPILQGLVDPTRFLMGENQRAWLNRKLGDSLERGATWRIIGQQTMMGQLKTFVPELANPPFFDGFVPLNMDQWDGYESERFQLLDFIERNGINNVCVVTGDIHSSWAQDVAKNPFDGSYNPATGQGALAVEFITPAITSQGVPEPAASQFEPVLLQAPHLKYLNLSKRGYMVLDITESQTQADWFHIDDVVNPVSNENFAAAWKTLNGTSNVINAGAPAVAAAERTLAPELSEKERWMIA